ncbi:7902_t:CDS:2 [Acaulospora morrowiae]|uniref:7902_t:CDS:1 n=1 Tax=Acaulospora morrowiae TaxID=94023 RepID=A0A9N9FY38_9GLOM|nr:7902_t:CDS:2 [Acaulospora morrowiae]
MGHPCSDEHHVIDFSAGTFLNIHTHTVEVVGREVGRGKACIDLICPDYKCGLIIKYETCILNWFQVFDYLDSINTAEMTWKSNKRIRNEGNITSEIASRRSIRLQQRFKHVEEVKDVPYLPDEVINNIFEYLNLGTKYACLFISRRMCRLMVQILWRAPFKFCTSFGNHKLITTYVSCLDPSRREVLKQAGIILPDNMSTPLFPYQCYLKEFSLNPFENMVFWWYTQNQKLDGISRFGLPRNFEILMTEMSQLIFNSACLKHVDISLDSACTFLPEFQSFSRFKFIGENITSLSTGIFFVSSEATSNQLIELLKSTETSVNKIQCMDIIHFCDYVPEFVRLIKAQSNLRQLSLRDSNIVKPILRVLSTTATTTLTWLGLEMISLQPKSLVLLTTCQNLETLVLVNCLDVPVDEFIPSDEPPIDHQFVNLRKLHIIDNRAFFYVDLTGLREIFQMTSRSLKELIIDMACSLQMRALLSSMIEISPMITSLAVCGGQSDIMFKEFQEWLEISKLECLILRLNENNIGTFIKDLCTHFPNSLVHLDIDSLITPTQLSNFLNKCDHVNFKRLGLNDRRGINDEHLHILMKYAEYFGSLEIVEYDRWATRNKWVKPSKFSDEKLKKAGRFIRVIRRDVSYPFHNPMDSNLLYGRIL